MRDLNFYFKSEFQFALKRAVYELVEADSSETELQLHVKDSLLAKVRSRQLDVEFKRNVQFEPDSVFRVEVVFELCLNFKNEVSEDDIKGIEWREVLKKTDNPYLGNVMSRASNIISTLTSSYGQQPLITPPSFMDAD